MAGPDGSTGLFCWWEAHMLLLCAAVDLHARPVSIVAHWGRLGCAAAVGRLRLAAVRHRAHNFGAL
jgi:hypothetical protein